MSTIGRVVLRIADNDRTWYGFGWLRPEKGAHIGWRYVVLSSILLSLPGVAAGALLLLVFLGRVESFLWVMMFGLALLIELPLHMIFAHYWNRRAELLETDT